MRLNETEMVKLLPAWMQEDGSDKGLATGCDIISRDAYARLKLLSRWDKIDQLNDAELDEMAWELNIQWYDSTAPIAVKRAVIRSSDRVYAKLGTPYAVEQIVADYFGTGEVREWYQYGGQPHHFKVLSDNPSLVNSNLDLFLKLLRTVKRRSSWLDAILICLTGEMFLYRELGLYAEDPDPEVGEVLYCYGNCGDLAEWIPPSGGATIVEKTIDIVTAIGTATNVTAYIPADAYATKEDYETYKAIALGAQATAEEALALARQAIAIAQAAEASANDLSNAVGQNTSKIATLWDAVFSDITSNPFQITFADLTGITLKSGVWNASLQRLEC